MLIRACTLNWSNTVLFYVTSPQCRIMVMTVYTGRSNCNLCTCDVTNLALVLINFVAMLP